MPAARARWAIDRFADDDDADPFDVVALAPARVDPARVGTPVDLVLDDSPGKRLVALYREEQALDITCSVKEIEGTSCTVCPLRLEVQPFPQSRLCAIGVEQERLATQLAVARARAAR